jgi:antitoxin HicB
MTDYPIVIMPINDEDGGGWLGYAVDLYGCMSDGETPEQALTNTLEAIQDWMAEYRRLGRDIPAPGSAAKHHQAHIQNLFDQIDQFDDMDSRIENVSKSLAEMREELEHILSNERFESIVSPYHNQVALISTFKTKTLV